MNAKHRHSWDTTVCTECGATRKPTATDKRLAAIKAVNDAVVTNEPGQGNVWKNTDRTVVATMIRSLADKGRTEAWQARVEQWATMVETEEEDKPFSEWAFFQGGIWVCYAA